MNSSSVATKRELARQVLETLFVGRSRIAIAEAVEKGQEIGVSRTTLIRACKDLGIHEVHNGPYGAFWERA